MAQTRYFLHQAQMQMHEVEEASGMIGVVTGCQLHWCGWKIKLKVSEIPISTIENEFTAN